MDIRELMTTGSDIQPVVGVDDVGFVTMRIGKVTYVMSHILAEEIAVGLLDRVKYVDALRQGTLNDPEVCGGTGNHEGQSTQDCDECNPQKYDSAFGV